MSIGLKLKQARENKGITLQEASTKTKILPKYLEALENDDFAAMPSNLYAKGFLKTYSQFLGLSQDEMVLEMESSGMAKEKQVIVLENKEMPPVRRESYSKKILFSIIGACVVLGLTFFFISMPHRQFSQLKKKPVVKIQQKKEKKQAVSAIKKPQPAVVNPRPVVNQVQAKPVSNGPLNLTAVAKRACHLSVKADGTLLYEGFMLAGVTEQWQAKKTFELGISDGSALGLIVNGKKITQAAKGERRDIIITRDGIRRR